MKRPQTTLFMLVSVDGKISTGSNDDRDFDKDLHKTDGIKEGLQQYYDLEQQTDLCSFNSGRVMAKVGWNETKDSIEKIPVDFVIVDNKPHLTELGVTNLLARTKKLYLVMTNKEHPALRVLDPNLEVITYEDAVDFNDLFIKLAEKGIDKVTIQSGGELNAILIRSGLLDYISLVYAPLFVGGKNTTSLVDGKSIETNEDLKLLKTMTLIEAKPLENSFLHLRYKVNNS